MKVRVLYTTQLKMALGLAGEDVILNDGGTLAQLVEQLSQRHGARFRNLMMDGQGKLLPSILLCLGNEQAIDGTSLRLSDGDEVTILSAISGG